MATVLTNNPPSDVEILLERLADENRDLSDRADELIGGADRCEVSDVETAGKATLHVKLLSDAITLAETRQTEAKRPHFLLANAAFDFFKPTIAELKAAKAAVLGRMDVFAAAERKRAEEERKRLEDEARKRQAEADRIAALAKTDEDLDLAIESEQAAQAVAAQAAAAPTPVKFTSVYGHTASGRTTWEYEVTDMAKVPRQFLMLNEAWVKAHIKARAKGKAPDAVEGIRFFEKTSTVVR